MNKKRLLIVNDSSFLGTGYGVYGKELLTRLHKSDKYEIAELGCYATVSSPQIKDIPWKFYPNAVADPNDERQKAFHSNPINAFGAWRFEKVLLDFKPDIVFDIRDYWMYAYMETSPLRKYFKWCIMPTVDSAPQKKEWLYTFANADVVVPYTEWARNVLTQQSGNNINLFHKIANAGVDEKIFVPVKDKRAHKIEMLGSDLSITGTVMRNQKRKLFPNLMKSYRAYLDRLLEQGKKELYSKSFLYLHTSYPESNGWDLPSLLIEHGLADKTLFTFVCKNCKYETIDKFKECSVACPKCNKNALFMPSANIPVSTNYLVKVYNLFDIFVQYAICEGFGMPQIESAACGVPIVSVDYSAMSEIVRNLNGYPIPVKALFRELETGADRAHPDDNHLIDVLYDFHVNTNDEQKKIESKRVRKKCIEHYTWDDVYKVWDSVFDSIDVSDKPSWGQEEINPTNVKLKVPNNINPTDMIEYVINNIINEPYLLNTAQVKALIKNVGNGIFPEAGGIKPMTMDRVVSMLESFLNNKNSTNNARMNPETIGEEDFLNVN